MSKLKKWISVFLICAMSATMMLGCGKSSESSATEAAGSTAASEQSANTGAYPSQPITGISTFDTSSGTFSDAVKLCGYAEQYIEGGSITVTDKAGGAGAVGTEYVFNQPADGYTLLCGTDSVSQFAVMELSDITYDDFVPVILSYGKVFFMVGNKDSKYNCLQDLIDDAKANPGRVTVATTGTGSVPFVWFSLLANYYDVQFNMVQYNGNGDAITALMGGHVDVFITNTQQALPYVETGDVKPITRLFDNEIPQLEGVESISEACPDLAAYSGFGNFFQISVHKDTPQEIVDQLTDAFKKAWEEEEYQKYMSDNGHAPLGLSGEEAIAYMKNHQAISSYILYDSGATQINPADLGIERP